MNRQTEIERLMGIAVAAMPELPEILDAFQQANAVYQEAQRVVEATFAAPMVAGSDRTDRWVRP